MVSAASFVDSVLESFRKILSEITTDTLEHDFSPRFGRYFCEGVLGYNSNDIRYERGRTDITLTDENGFRLVLIETKRPREDLGDKKWQTQAGSYADSNTRFIGLTNGYRFLLWEIRDKERSLRVDVAFDELFAEKKFTEQKLSSQVVEQVLFLNNISKTEIWNESKYDKFNEFYATIDISDDEGFDKLIDRLNYIANDLLRQFTYNAFDEYFAGYHQYQKRMEELADYGRSDKSRSSASKLADLKVREQAKYKKYTSFEGYYEWCSLSNRSDKSEEENKAIFCKESIYVLLNRLLFIRICEDKGLLKKRISNGGIEQLRELLREDVIDNSEQLFKQIVFSSYSSARSVYSHLFEKGNPLDWYESGDGELNRVLNKILWILNHFSFSKIDKDILGKLYEKYLPKDERKRLGEFYTPDEVIDYILDSVDYDPSHSIDEKNLIDPSCGSGGFLVRATRRLIGRYAVKFEKATPKESIDIKKWPDILSRLTPKECEVIIAAVSRHIHGFDINPFAAHITEMNLLFQVIDLYQKARQSNPKLELGRFRIYQTDSLELPSQQTDLLSFSSPTGQSLAKDKIEIDELKKKKYDFVVGNPPWLGILRIGKNALQQYKKYQTAQGKFDIYVLFIELGLRILSENGKLGYITQNRFIKANYATSLRNHIVTNAQITHLSNFGDLKVFADAINYPAILILQKRITGDTFSYAEFKERAEEVSSKELLDQLSQNLRNGEIDNELMHIVQADQKTLKDVGWSFGNDNNNSLLVKLNSLPRLSDFVEEIMQGVTAGGEGSDKIFYIPKERKREFEGEESILKPVLRGKDIRRYYLDEPTQFLIYPYESDGRPIDLRLYPRTKRYLEMFKTKLSGRRLDGKGLSDWNKEWYELWRKREATHFRRKKIVSPRISESNRFEIDDGEYYLTDSAVAIIPKNINIDFLLGLLNSKLVQWYIPNVSLFVQGRYYSFTKTYVERIPIRVPDTKDESLICQKITENVKALRKKIHKPNDKEDLTRLVKEIDELVYELYGLNQSEKKMVEKDLQTKFNVKA